MEYLFGVALLAIVWTIFYIRRQDLRKEILTMSLLAAPIALFDLAYVPSYWIPKTLFNFPVGLEGVLFSFFIGGIASASYAELSHKKLSKMNKYHKKVFAIVLALILPTAYIINHYFSTNIAIGMYIALMLGICTIIFLRKDLLKSVVAGSIVFGSIYAVALIIWSSIFPHTQGWFTLEGLPRLFVINAPLYEVIFGFLFGAYWGSLYELIFGYRFKN